MTTLLAYALLLVGMPVFVGMFVSSFLFLPITKKLPRLPAIERTHVQLLELLNGLIAAITGAFLFKICGLRPSLLAPLILAVWISVYCLASHERLANWLSWLAGLVIGWFALAKTIVAP